MSSEAGAWEAVIAKVYEITGAELTDDLNPLLDALQQQIERRLLAQQPCYVAWYQEDVTGYKSAAICYRCPTCTARQTQETSG